jgi:hypothetical protein
VVVSASMRRAARIVARAASDAVSLLPAHGGPVRLADAAHGYATKSGSRARVPRGWATSALERAALALEERLHNNGGEGEDELSISAAQLSPATSPSRRRSSSKKQGPAGGWMEAGPQTVATELVWPPPSLAFGAHPELVAAVRVYCRWSALWLRVHVPVLLCVQLTLRHALLLVSVEWRGSDQGTPVPAASGRG